MLLDLPPEIIILITDHLALPPKDPLRLFGSCPHLSGDQDRRLTMYDASETSEGYETDILRFTMADPYIASCITNSGRQFEVDATVMEGLGVVPCVPKKFRQMVKKIDFSFAPDLPSADFIARAPRAKDDLQTLQTCLLQFPAATRLDMDLDNLMLGCSNFEPVLGDHTTRIDSTTMERLRHDGPRQITDLVIHRFRGHLVYLAVAMPLPSLTRLHVGLECMLGPSNREWEEDYRYLFHRWSTVASIWRSLKRVQVCVTVTVSFKDYGGFPWDPRRHNWNLWQTSLTILSQAFSSLPGCEISLCITYKFPERRDTFPLQYFQKLEDGTHTLRNEVLPTNEAAIREFLGQSGPVLPFDMSIDYVQDDVTPTALVAVKYRPSFANASLASNTSSTEEVLVCKFDQELKQIAYLRAVEAGREAAELHRF